jgi:hypothetical protein
MAASTLYEAIEPRILWRQMLTAILGEIHGDGSEYEVSPFPGVVFNTSTDKL